MSIIVETLKSKLLLNSPNIVSEEEIYNAEEILSLKFAKEYKDYLSEFAYAVFDGHELTGICKISRLNVVDVTLEERNYNNVPNDWYVIEQANIDGIVIWQSKTGEIYQTAPNSEPIKLCDSLSEYIYI